MRTFLCISCFVVFSFCAKPDVHVIFESGEKNDIEAFSLIFLKEVVVDSLAVFNKNDSLLFEFKEEMKAIAGEPMHFISSSFQKGKKYIFKIYLPGSVINITEKAQPTVLSPELLKKYKDQARK